MIPVSLAKLDFFCFIQLKASLEDETSFLSRKAWQPCDDHPHLQPPENTHSSSFGYGERKRKTTNFSAILCPTPPPPCLVQRPPLFFSCLTHCDKTSNNIWKYFWPIFSSWHCSCTLTTPFCRLLEFWVGKG